MQVSIEAISGLERRLTIGVPAERIDNRADERLKEAAKTMRINGFRKGKVPLKVVRQQYGESVRQEILNDVINTSLQDAFSQEQLQPAGQPRIEINQFKVGKDLEYSATFEVYPEVIVGSFDGLSVEKITAEINDENIENMINSLREQKATYKVVERAAADGDKVNISYIGTKDGEEFDGGKGENQDLIIGSKSMIPGFEEGLIGLSAGDEKTLSLSFPEDYHAEELKGAAVEFTVTVHSVSENPLPELDADLLEQFGATHGAVDQFRADIVKNMERELSSSLRGKAKTAVMDKLLEANTIAIPKALIASEITVLREQMMQQFGGIQQNKEHNMASLLPDDMFKEQAERRVNLGLLLSEVIKTNEIKADADRVRTAIEELSVSYENPQEMINYYYQTPKLLSSIEASVLEDVVVDFILAQATVTEKTVTYEEAVKKQA